MTDRLDPQIEILFQESSEQTIIDRYELPLYFIVGGADDTYLARLMGISVEQLRPILLSRSVDTSNFLPNEPFGVYASRSTVISETWARTFPLSLLLQKEWPILDELSTPSSQNFSRPDHIQQTWILRAIDRVIDSNLKHNIQITSWQFLYDNLRDSMLESIYPQTLSLTIRWPNDNNQNLQYLLRRVFEKLSEQQLDYPLYILVDDLPIQYNLTFRDVRDQLAAGPCSSADLRAIRTSVELISL